MAAKTHLVIPDSHANPLHNNKRFELVGKLILDLKPDVVVNIGDGADMESLCSYDVGKKSYEGRRYIKDIGASHDANDKLWHYVRKAKKKMPRKVYCIGNHEERINRAVESDAKLEGVLSIEDLQLEHFGWEVYPFLDIAMVDGVAYSHYFTSGVMGRAIGGLHPAYSLLTKRHQSCTAGHLHTRDFAQLTRADGTHLLGMMCGCLVDYHMDYAGPANDLWWSGVVIKYDVEDGMYDHEWVSLERLKRLYG